MQKRETKWQRMEASAVGTSKAHLANSLVLLVTAGAVLTLLLAYLFGTPLWVAALAFAYWVGVLRLGVWVGGKFTVPQQERQEEILAQRRPLEAVRIPRRVQPRDSEALEAKELARKVSEGEQRRLREALDVQRRLLLDLERQGLLPREREILEVQWRLFDTLEAQQRVIEDMKAEQ